MRGTRALCSPSPLIYATVRTYASVSTAGTHSVYTPTGIASWTVARFFRSSRLFPLPRWHFCLPYDTIGVGEGVGRAGGKRLNDNRLLFRAFIAVIYTGRPRDTENTNIKCATNIRHPSDGCEYDRGVTAKRIAGLPRNASRGYRETHPGDIVKRIDHDVCTRKRRIVNAFA